MRFSRCSHLMQSLRQNLYAIPLRLIIGYGFMAHGYAKLVRGPEHFTNILHVLGMPVPELLAWATIIVELLGGFRSPRRRVHSVGEHSHGNRSTRSHFHGSLSKRIQFDQIAVGDGSRCLLRATGIRDRPAVPGRAYRLGPGRIRTSCARSDLHPTP